MRLFFMTYCEWLDSIVELVALFLIWVESLTFIVRILCLFSGIVPGSCLNMDQFWEMKVNNCVFELR